MPSLFCHSHYKQSYSTLMDPLDLVVFVMCLPWFFDFIETFWKIAGFLKQLDNLNPLSKKILLC